MARMRSRSMRGVWLVIGLFALGGMVLGGLFLAPRPASPPAPAQITWGVPARQLRFASYNILHDQRGLDRVAAEIIKMQPDFVFLQEVESADCAALAKALGMEANFYPRLYETSVNLAGPHASWGNLILSRHPLYDAASIPNPGGGSFGVWADAVVDGKKFVIADVHLSATWNAKPSHIKESGENRYRELTNLVAAWKARGSPPIVVAGDFNQIPMGNNYAVMTQPWTDAMASLGHTGATFGEGLLKTRIDYFLTTKDFKPLAGGIGNAGASDHRPIWIDLTASATNAPTTNP
jgi:endonuclease/exonuclease/phosphatase family metal-dependent hydrolase